MKASRLLWGQEMALRLVILEVVFCCVLNGIVRADGLAIRGFMRQYNSFSLHEDRELFRRNWLRLDLEYAPDEARFFASLDFVNENLSGENVLEETLREAYIEFPLGPVDWTIGKQQTVWGKADGTFITDVVNPFDLRRNFLVFDFPDMRIGLNSVKATYYYNDTTLEVGWIPTFVPFKLAPPGAPWALSLPELPLPIIQIDDPALPDNSLSHSETGLRLLTRWRGYDITLNYLYVWDDLALLDKQIVEDPIAGPGLVITPRFHRVHVPGYSLVNAFGSYVVRSEGALFLKRAFDTTDPEEEGFFVEKPFLNFMVGADYRIDENWLLLGQYIQGVILGGNGDIELDRLQTAMTLRLSGRLADRELKPSIFWYFNFDDGDFWLWPEVSYKILDGLNGVVGFHLFEGSAQSLYGQFDGNDYAFFKLQYSF